MFSIFKRKGLTYKERVSNDFANAKGAIRKGEKLTDRDMKMIAVGRTQVHSERQSHFMNIHPEKFEPATVARHKKFEQERQKKADAWKKKQTAKSGKKA